MSETKKKNFCCQCGLKLLEEECINAMCDDFKNELWNEQDVQLEQIGRLIKKAKSIINSGKDWDVKYNLIFGLEIAKKIKEFGFQFDWYDPDCSYEDDVRAFYNALKDFKERYI